MVSCHTNAATYIKLPLWYPKLWEPTVDLETVDAAYLLIKITKIGKWRKYPAVNHLKLGERWVDLYQLQDLIKWHEIEYEIINGIYFDSGSVSIATSIRDVFELRKQALVAGDEEEAGRIKKMLNRELYGKSLQHRKPQQKMYFLTYEEAMKFMCKNSNATSLVKEGKKIYVTIGKRWTDNYNMAYLGCSILSMARRIINNYIYTLQDNGVEVLYSNMDSIFIRTSDMAKFNELFPNAIGNDLGQFHYDYDIDGYESAREAIFIKKGVYILKLDEEHYQMRNLGNTIEDMSWEGYLSEYQVLQSKH